MTRAGWLVVAALVLTGCSLSPAAPTPPILAKRPLPPPPPTPDPAPVPAQPLPQPPPEPQAPTLEPPEPAPEPVPAPPTHDYGRWLLTGPFFATDAPTRWGTACTPGTVEVIVSGADADTRCDRSRLVIADADDLLGTGHLSVETVAIGQLAAVWFAVSGSGSYTAASYDRHRAHATARQVPLLVYFDGYGAYHAAAYSLLRAGDWAGAMAYPQNGEAPQAALDRVRANVAGLAWDRIALIRPLYTRGGALALDDVLAMQVPLTDLVREDARIVADLWFSWLRPSGAAEHPALADVGRQLAEAVR